MLQDYYEKHNLEMKPYEYYLAEFQNVNPEGVTSRLDIPFDPGQDNQRACAQEHPRKYSGQKRRYSCI